ncbi:MAG: hypothetical protein QXR54_02375 [Nanopusillaceae archaeon]
MAGKSSPIKEALMKRLSGGVSEADLPKVIEAVAKETGKQPRVIKAIFSRYLKSGVIKKEGNKYIWA